MNFDSAVAFHGDDQTTPTSTDAWEIANVSDRFAISVMLSRDFGGNGTHDEMRISGAGGSLMTQLGTTVTVGAASVSRWRLNDPAVGASRVLYGLLGNEDQVAITGCAVFNGVNLSDPIGDTDLETGETDTATSFSPNRTLDTTEGDKVVAEITFAGDTPVTVSSVTGVDNVRVNRAYSLEGVLIVEKDAVGATTVMNPTVNFSGTNSAQWRMDVYVLKAAEVGPPPAPPPASQYMTSDIYL